jgi:hypothetical protein
VALSTGLLLEPLGSEILLRWSVERTSGLGDVRIVQLEAFLNLKPTQERAMLLSSRNTIWLLVLFSNLCLAESAVDKTLREMTTEKPGSPYHWVSEHAEGGTVLERVLIGKPGPTVADHTTKTDILKNIGAYEEKAGGSAMPEVIEVRRLPKVKDDYNEVWVISRGGEKMAYTVTLTPSPKGGVDLRIQGPWD